MECFPENRGGGYWQDVVMCLTVICCSLIERLASIHVNWGWIVEPLGFAYGIIAANYSERIKKWMSVKWPAKSIGLLLFSGILGIAYLRYKPVAILGDYLLKIILGISITVFIFTVLSKVSAGNRVNSFLGRISYEVYLLHGTAFSIVMMVGVRNSGVFVCMSIVTTILLSIGLKLICNRLLKKRKDICR